MKDIQRHEGQKMASVWFEEDMMTRVDRLAVKGDISRARLIRNLTEIGVEYLEASEKFGFLQTALVLRDFAKWFKETCDAGLGTGRRKARA